MLALTPNDIDFRTGHVAISKTWHEHFMQSGTPKTKSSRRTIVLPARTRIALRAWSMQVGVRGDSRVFQFEPRNLSKKMQKAMRSANVPVIGLHTMRHTFATLALA